MNSTTPARPRTILVLGGVLLVVWLVFFEIDRAPHPSQEAYLKVQVAARAYADKLKSSGSELPKFITLPDLVAAGVIQSNDVVAFSGFEVTVGLQAGETTPQSMLMGVRTPDGVWNVAIGDGSVQQMTADRYQALLRQ